MHFYRRRKYLRYLPLLLACAVLLRSFIAPGYMLSASSEDGLGIIFCDGLVSVIAQTEHSGHHQHGGEEIRTEVHISPICSEWSTSSLLLVPAADVIPKFTLYSFRRETPVNSLPVFRRFPLSKRITRGPPQFV